MFVNILHYLYQLGPDETPNYESISEELESIEDREVFLQNSLLSNGPIRTEILSENEGDIKGLPFINKIDLE